VAFGELLFALSLDIYYVVAVPFLNKVFILKMFSEHGSYLCISIIGRRNKSEDFLITISEKSSNVNYYLYVKI